MKVNVQWISRIFVLLALASATTNAQTVDVKALAEHLSRGATSLSFATERPIAIRRTLTP